MNPWKAIVVKHKAKSVKPIPDGWLTRAQVAEKIGCAENRVAENLRDALAAKDILTDKFAVWDAIEGKVINVVCYKINDKKRTSAEPEESSSPSPRKRGRPPKLQQWPYAKGTRVRRMDGGQGVMLSGGMVRWDSGSVTTPKGSSIRKIKPL